MKNLFDPPGTLEAFVSSAHGDQSYCDAIRLNEKDQQSILHKLNATGGSNQSNELRAEDRLTYTANAVIVQMKHPGGNIATYKVRPRNLSRGGIGFLHGSFCYNDTPCTITLRTIENDKTEVQGAVVRCVHVQGNVHEVGVKFDEPIELYRYVQAVRTSSDINSEDNPKRLRGKVLFVSSSIDDRELFNFIGDSVGLTVDVSDRSEHAEQLILVKALDLVIIEENLPESNAEELMGKIREHGFNGPILVLSDAAEGEHDGLLAKGFAQVLPKPIQMEATVEVLGKFLIQDHSGEAGIESIYSEQWENRKMRPLILNFLERLEGRMEDIHRVVMQKQVEEIAMLAQEVKGSSGGFGYPQIGEAAESLIQAASGGDDAYEQIKDEFTKLTRLCSGACKVRHEPIRD